METPFGVRDFSYTFALLPQAQVTEGSRIVVCTARDVTALNHARQQAAALLAEAQDSNRRLQAANVQLHALAMHDGLTGLLNHRALRERLDEEFRRAARHNLPLALLLLDIDHFKDYNDAFGHLAGDDSLQQVAETLRACARETDTPARYGGEEFFVVLPQTTLPGALVMAERIRQRIERLPTKRPITVSIGAAT